MGRFWAALDTGNTRKLQIGLSAKWLLIVWRSVFFGGGRPEPVDGADGAVSGLVVENAS